MKFISVHHADQTTDLWSDIPRSIIETLRSLGHEVVLVDRLLPRSTPLLGLKRVVYQYLFRKVYNNNRDPRLPRARAAALNRRIAAHGPADAVLFTFLPDAAFVQTPHPVFVIHDCTWIGTLDYYTPSSHLAGETVDGGIALDTLALERCTAAIYSSQWAVDSAVRDYGIARQKLHIAPLGANLHPPPTREDIAACLLQRGHGPMKLLFVGQDWHRKGGGAAIQICRHIERLGTPVELTVVGCVPTGDVPAFVRNYPRLDKTVPEQKTLFYDLFRSSDFFLLPTRAEAFGIVFAEAAAFALPVLTSDTGGVTGALHPAWSLALPLDTPPAEFAAWAVKNFRDRAAYQQMSWAARDAFESYLNWNTLGRKIVALAAACKHTPATQPGEAA